MDNIQMNKSMVDDKENMDTEYFAAGAKNSVGRQQYLVDSQKVAQNQQPKVMRLGARSPFQQINLESIQNAKSSLIKNQENEEKVQIVGFEENYSHMQSTDAAMDMAIPLISVESSKIASFMELEVDKAVEEIKQEEDICQKEDDVLGKQSSEKKIGDFEIEIDTTSQLLAQNSDDSIQNVKEGQKKGELMEILNEQEGSNNEVQSKSKEASDQMVDVELEQKEDLESGFGSQGSFNVQDTKQVDEIVTKKSVLDLKHMPKDQLMKNLQDLIEANNSSIASGDSTPGNSQSAQTNLNISESTKKRRKALLKEAYGPNNKTISSSIASMPVLKSTIYQSLKVLRGVVQDSKADAQTLDESRHASLRQSISSMQEARKKYQNKSILQEDKQKELDPLDLIIQEKAEAELGIKNIKKHQSDAVKTILGKQNCIYRYTSTADKNLVYQLPALFAKGLTLYLSTSISRMAEQIPSLPETIPAACFNNLSSKENNQKIIELVQSGEVKMLYVTPDKLAELLKYEIPKIENIVIDEFNFSEDPNGNQLQLNPFINEVLHKEGRSWTILVLIPPTSRNVCINACELYDIPNELSFPDDLNFDTIPHISISRDEETNKALLSLLRNQKFSNNLCVVVYTSHKRAADDLSVTLTQNGIKNLLVLPGKTESQKLELYNSFTKNSVQAIVTVSGTELGFDKGLLRRTVHYNMPKTPERFAQEVLYLSKQAKCHIFVTDDEYFSERNNFFSTIVYPDQIAKFIEKVLLNSIPALSREPLSNTEREIKKPVSPSGNMKSSVLPKGKSMLEKRKRDGTVLSSNKEPTTSGGQNTAFLSKSLTKPKVEEQDLVPKDEVLSLRSSELTHYLKLSKDSVVTLFEQMSKLTNWIEYHGISPHTISVRFVPSVNNANLKNGPKSPALHQIWQLLQAKSKKFTGVVRIVVPDIAAEMKTSSVEVLKQMKRYDVLEEIFQYKIKQIPNAQDIEESIAQTHDIIAEKAYKAIRDLDCCYIACKQFAVQKVDHLSRQKGSIGTARSRSSSVKPVTENSDFDFDDDVQEDSTKDPQRTALKQKLIQRIEAYLNDEDMAMNLSMDETTASEELPLLRLTTKRDKSLMMTELQGFISYYLEQPGCNDSGILDPKGLVSEELQRVLCRQAVRVAIGVPPANSTNEWKTCKFWGRYNKYDPFELTLLFSEAIETIVSSYKQLKKTK